MKIVLIIVALLIVVNVVRIVVQNTRVPELGLENGQFKPLSKKPNAVSTQAEDVDKRVAPWPFKDSLEDTVSAIESAVNQYGGAELKSRDDNYLYYVFTTPTMHFHDDVEFYLNEKERTVEFRSASRAGYSDMGLNRKRYDALKELYDQAGVEQ